MTEHHLELPNDADLWDAFKNHGDSEAKKKLIEKYVTLVEFVSGRLAVGLPRNVSKDDLSSYGIMGLIDAVEKFEPSRGLQFETYASWRIRGAIIDGLRQGDWVPRSVREKARKLEDAYRVLEQQYLRSVTDQEVAEYLDLSENDVQQWLQDISVTTIISLEDPIKEEDGETRMSMLVDDRARNPEHKVNVIHQKEQLAGAIDRLTEKERLVITLLYYEELTLSEIANVLSLSPSRISQLHSKAILRLRGALGNVKNQLLFD